MLRPMLYTLDSLEFMYVVVVLRLTCLTILYVQFYKRNIFLIPNSNVIWVVMESWLIPISRALRHNNGMNEKKKRNEKNN